MQYRATSALLIATITAIATLIAFDKVAYADTVTPSFSDGIHQVGTDVAAGTYVTNTQDGICLVSITDNNDRTRNPTFINRAIITLTVDDSTLETTNCGDWREHSSTTQKPRATQFGQGTYHIGVDIAPGIYTANSNNGRCLWFTVNDFTHHADPNQLLTWWKTGKPIVEITNETVGFYSIRCGTWQLREFEPPTEPATRFYDGSHLVGIEIASGNYIADAGEVVCNWFRTAPFGDRSPDNTGGYVSKGRQIVTILPTDTGFFSEGCGMWQPISSVDLTADPSETIGRGTFAIGIDIQPGAYVADAIEGRSCRWFLLSGFAGRPSDIVASGNGLLRGVTEIPSDAIGFRSIDCQDWTSVDNLSQDIATRVFGDGEHVVNVHISPGVYESPGPVSGRCTWRRLSGYAGTAADHVAVRNPVGKNIAEIRETDAVFKAFGCGEWVPLVPGSNAEVQDSFDHGTWIVDAEIAPGTYAADVPTGSTCFWSRLASFSGEIDALTESESTVGRSVTTIRDFDTGFYSDGCGTWEIIADDGFDLNVSHEAPFDDGTYIVNRDIAAGTYIAQATEGETCYWSRMIGFDGDFFNRINIYSSKGQAIATIRESDAGFRSFGCGTWRKLSADYAQQNALFTPEKGDANLLTRFSDGTFRVGIDIAAGRYVSIDADHPNCRWRRLNDFTWTNGVVVETIASGIKIVDIAESDVGFASVGCGEWSLWDSSEIVEPIERPTRFSSGSYMVGLHIEPGTYIASPRTNGGCRWSRVRRFGGTESDVITSGSSDARWIVTIEPQDEGFVTYGCGTWRSIDTALRLGPFESFDDGSYIANVEVTMGTYIADVPTQAFKGGKPVPVCRWYRVSSFGHTANSIIDTGGGKGRIEVTIAESDVGFVSTGCGSWRKTR